MTRREETFDLLARAAVTMLPLRKQRSYQLWRAIGYRPVYALVRAKSGHEPAAQSWRARNRIGEQMHRATMRVVKRGARRARRR